MNNFRRRGLSGGGINIDQTTGRGMIDGYEVVDLGLSNGLLFATCNVGATKETDYGDYYKYGAGSQTFYANQPAYLGMENPLASSVDTATQVMGSGWRMPTSYELMITMLVDTNYEWVTNFNGSGINGAKFTSKTNPNAYMFFPAAGVCMYGNHAETIGTMGYVLSSTPNSDNSSSCYCIQLNSDGVQRINYARSYGISVRGVYAAV